ncbi:MAG TPA: hypothetical protein VHE35_22945, partial [Kofleriaceae bacterium]|nr:hypothetical protein [Kofleriaceae bacterium]
MRSGDSSAARTGGASRRSDRAQSASRARTSAIAAAGALAAAALVTLAGCSSEAESFSLRLSWSQGGDQECPPVGAASATCQSIPISCDARVLIRIVPDTAGGVPYYSHCYRMTGARDACALANLEIQPSDPIPNEMVKVQVAVWSEDQLAGAVLDDDGCPASVPFDLLGLPSLTATPPSLVPALGGEIYFPVGDRRGADVPLGCPRYDQLDTMACRIGAPTIEAGVRDPLSGASVPASDTGEIHVAFGPPSADGKGGWRLNVNELEPLAPQAGDPPTWTTRLQHAVPALGCLEVERSEALSTPAAICRDTMVNDGQLTVDGYVVSRSLVRKVMTALGLVDFPDKGLVLGLVVNERFQPVAGAKVSVSSGTIDYPLDDFQTVGLDSTDPSGVFLSEDAPFDATWHAIDPSGIGDDGSARGGLIVGHVSVVVIKRQPHVGGAQAG